MPTFALGALTFVAVASESAFPTGGLGGWALVLSGAAMLWALKLMHELGAVILGLTGLALLLLACFYVAGRWQESKADDYSAGFGDGYAVGYNTACEIRATFIRGDWSNDQYAKGYAQGQEAGIVACNAAREIGAD